MDWVWFLLNCFCYVVLFWLLWFSGNHAIRLAIGWARTDIVGEKMPNKEAAQKSQLRAGRVIGLLERSLVFIGIVAARWEVLAGVVALKTVARYKELDQQINAEYFLIGSMASLLWAVFITGCIVWFDATIGLGIIAHIRNDMAGSPTG